MRFDFLVTVIKWFLSNNDNVYDCLSSMAQQSYFNALIKGGACYGTLLEEYELIPAESRGESCPWKVGQTGGPNTYSLWSANAKSEFTVV